MRRRTTGHAPRTVGLLGVALTCVALAVWAAIGLQADADERTRTSARQPIAATDDELLRQAEERLISDCMATKGFAYNEQPPPAPSEAEPPSVIEDVGWAREHGYGDVLNEGDPSARDVNFDNFDKLTPNEQQSWQRTLLGSGRQLTADIPDLGRISAPDNGCTAQARRMLYRDLAGWYQARRIVDHLDTYVSNRVIGDSHYRTRLAEWATCVRGHGYTASSPRELRSAIARDTQELPVQQARAREVAAAETEAVCAVSSTLPQIIRSLERKYRPEIEKRFALELKALESFEQEAIPMARQILADS